MERRGETRPLHTLEALFPNELLAIAAITASELLTAVYRANTSARRQTRERFLESIFAVVPILPFDLAVAREHARLTAQLIMAGQMIGGHDLQIAATALAHGNRVLTANLRDFQRVPGLSVDLPGW